MITNIYAIRDEKSGFDHVFSSLNDAFANREFSVAVKDENSIFNHYPTDFSLHRVATFDSVTGIVTPDKSLVCSAKDILGE